MIVTDIPHVAQYLLEKYNLAQQGWKFVWDNAKRRAGQCRYRTKQISLSRHYVALNITDRLDDIIDTLLHEIAHAIAGPGTNHGPKWQTVCHQIGARPERCYDIADVIMPQGKYVAVCGGCGYVFHRHKEPRSKHKRYIYCRACGPEHGRLTYQHTTTVTSTALPPKRLR